MMKPQTFMNLSGEAVHEAAQFYKIPADHVLVIYDDVSLPVGKLRVRLHLPAPPGDTTALQTSSPTLGTDQFPRGENRHGDGGAGEERDMIDWVIGVPSQAERKTLLDVFSRAIDAAECVIENGDCQKAMNHFN